MRKFLKKYKLVLGLGLVIITICILLYRHKHKPKIPKSDVPHAEVHLYEMCKDYLKRSNIKDKTDPQYKASLPTIKVCEDEINRLESTWPSLKDED